MPFDYIKDPRWNSLDPSIKKRVISLAFEEEVATDPRFSSLPDDQKMQVQSIYTDEARAYESKLIDDMQSPGILSTVGKGLAHGGIGLAESVGTGVEYLGNRVGSESMANAGQAAKNYFSEKAEAYKPSAAIEGKNVWDNPEILKRSEFWLYNVADMVPALAASVIPGVAAFKGVKAVTAIPRLAKIAGAVAGGMSGGALEGSQTYNAVLAKGGTEEEAARSAELMAAGSGALNALSVGNILSTAGKTFQSKVLKHLGAAAWEGISEGLEEPTEVFSKYFGSYLAGQPLPTDLEDQLVQSAKDALTVAPIAALTGGGGSILAGNTYQPKQEIDPVAPSKAIIDARTPDEAIGAFESEMDGILSSLPDMGNQQTPIPFNISESDLEAQAMESDIQRQIRSTWPVEPAPARPATPQEINQQKIGMTEAIGQEIENIPETDGSEWVRMEDEANAETDYWDKTRQDILKQREPKPVKPPTQQEINQQKIGMTEEIGREISDFPEIKTGYESEQEKFDAERDIFLQKLGQMQNEVNGSRTRGVTQETINQPEAIVFPADSPEWMREVQEARKKDGKSALGRAELNTLFDKARSGKPLTENQQDQFNYVQRAAQKYAGPAGEMVAQEEADSLEKRGFDLLGGRKMAAGNLNQGDKVIATIDGVKDEFEVEDTNENGEVLLQDGVAKRVDMFDEISVEAWKSSDKNTGSIESPKSFKDMSSEELIAYSKSFQEKQKAIIEQAATEKTPSLYKKETYKGKEYTSGVIIHPSTKFPGKWQATAWDEKGFSGDSTHNTKEEAIQDAISSGNRLVGRQEFDRIAKTKEFNDGNQSTADAQRSFEDSFKKRQERIKELEPRLQSVLKLAADTPADLRPVDVDRVMDAADDQGIVDEFKAWISGQDGVQDKTYSAIFKWEPADQFIDAGKMVGREKNIDIPSDMSYDYVKEDTDNDSFTALPTIALQPTGDLDVARTTVGSIQEAASALSNIGSNAQEEAWAIATDKNGKIVVTHKFSKGVSSSSLVNPNQFTGALLRNNKIKNVYFSHNHPSGNLSPSLADRAIFKKIKNVLKLKKIKTSGLIIAGDNFVEFDDSSTGDINRVPQELKFFKTPVSERKIVDRKENKNKAFQNFGDIRERFKNEQDGILLVDVKNKELKFVPFKKGLQTRNAAAEILSEAESVNASAAFINVQTNENTNRGKFYRALAESLQDNGISLHDIAGKNDVGQIVSFRELGLLPSQNDTAMSKLDSGAVLFQTSTDKPPGQGITLKDIQQRFKGQEIFMHTDGTIAIRMKNGLGLIIEQVKSFGNDDIQIAMKGGRMTSKGVILGKYQDSKITLNQFLADTTTLDHENYHFLADHILTKFDRAVIMSKARAYEKDGKFNFKWNKDMDENEANAFAQFLNERENFRGTAFGKILQKFMDFVDGLVNIGQQSVKKLAREVESGKVYSRAKESSKKTGVDQAAFQTAPSTDSKAVAYQTSSDRIEKERTSIFKKWVKENLPGFKGDIGKLKYGYDTARTGMEAFDLSDDSIFKDWAVYNNIDMLAPGKKIRSAIEEKSGAIPEHVDAIQKEMLRISKTAKDQKIADEKYFTPIRRLIALSRKTVKDVDEYLYARHAPEANARLRLTNARLQLKKLIQLREDSEINQEVKAARADYKIARARLLTTEKGTPEHKAAVEQAKTAKESLDQTKAQNVGSGLQREMDVIDAMFEKDPFGTRQELYLALLERELKNPLNEQEENFKARWEAFKKKPSGMTDKEAAEINEKYKDNKIFQKIAVIFDRMNQDKLDILRASGRISKQEYAGLKSTFQYYAPLHREGYDSRPGRGRGISAIGKDFKARGGSTKRAVDILAHAFADYEASLIKTHKTEVARAFLQMVRNYPNENVWQIETIKNVPGYDDSGNLVEHTDMTEQDNEIKVKIDGKVYSITANNIHSDRLIKALKNDTLNTGVIVQGLAKINRVLAMVNTSLSPEFMVTNFLRDFQTAMVNVSDTEVAKYRKQVIKDIPKAMKGMHSLWRGDKSHDWANVADQFEKAGGKISWMDFEGDIKTRVKNLEKEIDLFRDGHVTQKAFSKLAKMVEDYNGIVENAVRLSVFKAGVDAGMTESKSALLAKDLTVNFQQKGVQGQLLNSLYLFANAGIQGSAKIVSVLYRSPNARKIVGASMLAAMALSMANRGIGGDDDDGIPYYDKVDDFIKERNIIFMRPGGKYFKIPLPWGYNAFWTVGTELGDMFSKKDYDLTDSLGNIMSSIAGAFNPLQSSTILQTIAPTLMDPFVQVGENKTWSGSPLMPENSAFAKVKKPDSELYWASARKPSVWLATQLNSIFGGNAVKSSGITDISPETLDLVWDTFTGSAGRFVADTASIPFKMVDGELTPATAPFSRRIMGQKSEHSDSMIYRENIDKVFERVEEIEVYPENKRLKEDKIYTLNNAAKQSEKHISKLNKLLKKAATDEQKKRYKELINKERMSFNSKYYKITTEKGIKK